MDQTTVNVVLRVKPNGDGPSDSVTVLDSEQSATAILRKNRTPGELLQFNFGRALENVSQNGVYEICGKEVIQSALQGYNATILAYGQTGSGKTYTMLGPESSFQEKDLQGIMPRAIHQVFSDLRGRGLPWSVKLTFVEIYNEAFRDLLMPNGRKEITIYDRNQRGNAVISLRGATRIEVESEDQALQCLQKGHRERAVACHSMNDRSSRSHTLLTLWIETTNEEGQAVRSKLNLVDLAGSERLRKTGASGAIAKEATFINKSLSSLALVVKELKRKAPHVRYRDSKLTHYLKDSLGGNCRTIMIACIWGDEAHLGESISTCRFADDIQQVEVSAQKNTGIDTIHGHCFKLDPIMMKYIKQMTAKRVAEERAKLYKELKKKCLSATAETTEDELTQAEHQELEMLRAKVKEFESLHSGSSDGTEKSQGLDEAEIEEIEILRKRVFELEQERQQEQKEREELVVEAEAALMKEMASLRERVSQLQQTRCLSAKEVEELKELREQVRCLQDKESDVRPDTPMSSNQQRDGGDRPQSSGLSDSGSVICNDDSEITTDTTASRSTDDGDQLRRLAERVKDLETVESISEEGPDKTQGFKHSRWESGESEHVLGELQEMRDRLKSLHGISVEKLNQKNVQELLEIKDRILKLQSAEARYSDIHTSSSGQCATQWTGSNATMVHSNNAVGSSPRTNAGLSPRRSAPELSAVEEVEMLRAENERMRRALQQGGSFRLSAKKRHTGLHTGGSELSPSPPLSPAAPVTPPTSPNRCHSPYSNSNRAPNVPLPSQRSTRRRLKDTLSEKLYKMIGRRKPDRLDQEYVQSGNEETPNIVILNSLTHDQLMDLLRAHRSTSKYGDDLTQDYSDPIPDLSLSPNDLHLHAKKIPASGRDSSSTGEKPSLVPPLMLDKLP